MHILAVAAAVALAWDAVLIPTQLGVACLLRGNSLGAGLEGGAVLGSGGTGAKHENSKADESGDCGGLHGKKTY